MIEVACLVLTAICVVTGVVLFVVSAHRDDGFLGLVAHAAMIIAAIPATVYGGVTS